LNQETINKLKIFNDPVYGFIGIPFELVYDLIEHPYFQRLRRIKQLGMSHLVYPGALHTRFHHALGAVHLMEQALKVIKEKGHEITKEEEEGVIIAILLHDIGHGPFSHSLENILIPGISHEDISSKLMAILNDEMGGKLNLALQIFNDTYSKKFLHQLVSSQLDMDRLDYLKRDSFFTGVSEGVISTERIIKMLNVKDDKIVVDAKGIYSIEKFIVARRLMYWQVYLHKTVVSAEHLLINIVKRARFLVLNGEKLFATPSFIYFLEKTSTHSLSDQDIEHFVNLDDGDVYASIKVWTKNSDKVLAYLCSCLVDRRLFKIKFQNSAFSKEEVQNIKQKIQTVFEVTEKEAEYFFIQKTVSNKAYISSKGSIDILYKDGTINDIANAADLLNISALSNPVSKHFICYPKIIDNK
jgi:HD superfamily phosphohydrolase